MRFARYALCRGVLRDLARGRVGSNCQLEQRYEDVLGRRVEDR